MEQLNKIKIARKHIIDSITYTRKKNIDSAISSRKVSIQQLQLKLKHKADSIGAIRKYKSSKRYTDSLARIRNFKIDSLRLSRAHFFDSIRAVRKKSLDSSLAIRKSISDALKNKQKIKADSIAAIRKYKESRRYRDSVQVTHQSRLDSIRIVRKMLSDKIISQRKKTIDSLTNVRKTKLEALNKLRKQKADSLKAIQDKRIEQLAKQKEKREKELLAEQKRKQDKYKLALEIKIKKKHEAWSNEKMLKKKWSFSRKLFQNTYTRYNYYFNARRKMQEANLNMQRRKKDNFENTIELFPFDPNTDSTVFASDMDSIIRKASVGIQIHDPRTKWADDLYLLMGQAYYYKGDFEKAKNTFKYVISMKSVEKKKKNAQRENPNALVKKDNKTILQKILQHKSVHNDAVLWLTRTDADSKKEAEAEAILDLMDASIQLSESMKNKIALEKANLYVKKGDLRDASKNLITVESSKVASKYIRQRAAFLNGQILTELGLYDSAAQRYTEVLDLHPSIEMDFYAHKNRANAIALSGADQSSSIATMKNLLRDGKYAPYHEQVYYILGKLSANNNNIEEALDYYTKSLQQPKTTTKQKAITFAAIGNIQYQIGKYNLAKRAYDSAAYFAKNKIDNEDVKIALKRSKSLDKIEEPYYTVQTQDSLLRLSAMSEKEQKLVIKKYLKYIEKQKEDSIANAQNAAAAGSLAGNNNGNASANWYFSSTVAVQQGYNEFKRKWGNRPLSDNWRRASASNFGNDLNTNPIDSNSSDDNNNQLDEASLLASIPKTDAQIKVAKNKLKKAYLQLGKAYINDLNEIKDGLASLDSLDKRFPDHEFGDEVLYWRYTAALRQSNLEEAEQLRTQFLALYPNSSFANKLSTNSTESQPSKDEDVAKYYEKTYQLAIEHQHKEVLERTRIAQKSYGVPSYVRKFKILEAQSLTAIGEYKKADTLLADYIKEFPSDSLRPWVDAILKHISIKRAADTLHKDSSSNNALIDSLAAAQKKANLPDEYTYEPKEAHYCLFIFNKTDATVAAFKAGLGDYSSIKFSGLSLSSTFEGLNESQSIVLTKSFGNASQAKIFLKTAQKEPMLFRDFPEGSYQACIISEKNYRKLKLDKKANNYLNFYQKNY